MPGPRNSASSSLTYSSSSPPESQHVWTPPPIQGAPIRVLNTAKEAPEALREDASYASQDLPQKPFIHDPGNGPRVRDTRRFLTSSFFAQPPALDDLLCAEFAQEEVLQMLCTVLPEETALILWYNKSRSTSRICPACQRLYRLGDVLPDHMDDEHKRIDQRPPPQLEHEQEISGLCSPVCFILASFNYPAAIKSAWGHTAEEMDDESWALLNSPGEGNANTGVSLGLGMLVRMTRLHDLGLAQLCLPDVDFDDGLHSDYEDVAVRA
ncbi:hypothetical protein B0H10DRAFT_2221067 [Mycena sp. CBHHK59/15]|nr:hypothetical protein B0H10DRAFT_2221067 [Mycena sp. CBHHK59/15]